MKTKNIFHAAGPLRSREFVYILNTAFEPSKAKQNRKEVFGMKSGKWLALALAAVMALSLRVPALAEDDTIKIGGIAPLTGPYAVYGVSVKNGADLYIDQLNAAGGIDLQFMGIGRNSHIGFNEPADAFSDVTGVIKLTPSTIEANKRFFRSADEVPREAISMGVGTIMRARKLLLIATGEDKRDAVRDMVQGDVSPRLPASVLRLHRDAIVVLDRAAAAGL